MFCLIMILAIMSDQFAYGLLMCFCILIACIMVDVLLFFTWASFLFSFISSIF